ncbi:MAG: class I SAM-dependent methyltransferase [Flavobacteriaceae bacterium]
MNNNNPKNVFNDCSLQYQDKFMDFDLHNDSFDLFCELIENKNASVLEIGCGPGNITKYILNKRPDIKLLGIDIAPNMIQLAKKNNPLTIFKVMDCKNILDINLKFDAILCGFTLPYLTKQKVLLLIENASVLLKPNGILYLSTMEDSYEKSNFLVSSSDKSKGIFTYYHEIEYLTKFLQENNFNVIETIRKEYPEPKDESIDLIVIAKKLS